MDWDNTVHLNDEEEAMQREYAKKIVASISEREDDPLKVKILLQEAVGVDYEIWLAATDLRGQWKIK